MEDMEKSFVGGDAAANSEDEDAEEEEAAVPGIDEGVNTLREHGGTAGNAATNFATAMARFPAIAA